MITRVRAVLITPGEGLLLIRRTWPGGAPYWVFPGGHVEPSDPDLRAALVREVREEVGADPQITGLLWVLADEHQRQHFYLGRIERWSEEDRTGPECVLQGQDGRNSGLPVLSVRYAGTESFWPRAPQGQ